MHDCSWSSSYTADSLVSQTQANKIDFIAIALSGCPGQRRRRREERSREQRQDAGRPHGQGRAPEALSR